MDNDNECTYCNYVAMGVDEDCLFTCGGSDCTPVAGPLPRVAEVSGEDEDEDEDEDENEDEDEDENEDEDEDA